MRGRRRMLIMLLLMLRRNLMVVIGVCSRVGMHLLWLLMMLLMIWRRTHDLLGMMALRRRGRMNLWWWMTMHMAVRWINLILTRSRWRNTLWTMSCCSMTLLWRVLRMHIVILSYCSRRRSMLGSLLMLIMILLMVVRMIVPHHVMGRMRAWLWRVMMISMRRMVIILLIWLMMMMIIRRMLLLRIHMLLIVLVQVFLFGFEIHVWIVIIHVRLFFFELTLIWFVLEPWGSGGWLLLLYMLVCLLMKG